ncbi:MAG: hypothetical protein M0Z50_00710 [Planctomycetia bacterium]|nr:hypothetical protein [Planctomycetia bacterium]
MKPSKLLKSASLSPWMEVEEGMLLVIPPASPPRPRSGAAPAASGSRVRRRIFTGGTEIVGMRRGSARGDVVATPSDTEMATPTRKAISPAAHNHTHRAKAANGSGGNEAPMPPDPCSPSSPGGSSSVFTETGTKFLPCGQTLHLFSGRNLADTMERLDREFWITEVL